MTVSDQIPDICRAIVRAGDDESAILRVVKRINFFLVAYKGCVDPFVLDIPYLVLTGKWTSVSAQAVAVTKNDIYIYIYHDGP